MKTSTIIILIFLSTYLIVKGHEFYLNQKLEVFKLQSELKIEKEKTKQWKIVAQQCPEAIKNSIILKYFEKTIEE